MPFATILWPSFKIRNSHSIKKFFNLFAMDKTNLNEKTANSFLSDWNIPIREAFYHQLSMPVRMSRSRGQSINQSINSRFQNKPTEAFKTPLVHNCQFFRIISLSILKWHSIYKTNCSTSYQIYTIIERINSIFKIVQLWIWEELKIECFDCWHNFNSYFH